MTELSPSAGNYYPQIPAGATLLRRVKLYCDWCCGDSQARECQNSGCPLWLYRTGRGPKKPRSAAQVAASREGAKRLKAYGKNGARTRREPSRDPEPHPALAGPQMAFYEHSKSQEETHK